MRTLAACILVLAAVLAGCSGANSTPPVATPDHPGPGSIAGVVVDEAVRPVKGATVALVGTNRTVETGADGSFALSEIEPGAYFVRATHPLYNTVQQSLEVKAGAADGTHIKLQLTRLIFAQPYVQTQKFDGFVVCSIGFFEYASEECGEGVGVPCEVPVPPGCERVGGQGNNFAQWDFWLDGGFARTLVVEMKWEPSSPTLSEFQLNVGNDWTCDPFCNGASLNVTGGRSPLYATVDFRGLQLKDRAGADVNFTADTRFSTFVWPNWGCANFGVPDPQCAQQLNVAINQPYQMFATAFYYLPAPAGWSFLKGDVPPF